MTMRRPTFHDEEFQMTNEELRAAFATSYPTAAADFAIFENSKEYSLESSAARSRWAAFKAGAEAAMEADRQTSCVYIPDKDGGRLVTFTVM